MLSISPYLNFQGNTEAAFNFYRSVIGGEFKSLIRFKDMPESDKLSAAEQEKIMHIALPLAANHLLMASDALESTGQKVQAGNNSYIMVQAESKEEADRFFQGLSAGGTIEMPMSDMFWGDYFGSFHDRFGIQWMIAFSNPQ
jgi:PhnB protein